LRVDDVRSRVDGARTSKLLLEAAKRLAMWDPSRQSAGAEVRAGARLVAEAEVALARFRRLDEVQKLLVDVTALTEAGVEPEEIEAKAWRASRMANEIADEIAAEVVKLARVASTEAPEEAAESSQREPVVSGGQLSP
jgi:hypothetical protein